MDFYSLLYLKNEWMNWADFLHAHKCQKLKVTMGMHMVKYGCDLSCPGTLKSALSQRINWWTTACCHYSANEMQHKHKNKFMRERFSCFVDYKTTLHFSCKKHFNILVNLGLILI